MISRKRVCADCLNGSTLLASELARIFALSIGHMILTVAFIGSLASGNVHADTQSDLDQHIQTLEEVASSVTADVPATINRLKTETNLGEGSLVVGGTLNALAGDTIEWPISFLATSSQITAIQFDLLLPSSFTLVSVAAGPAALAAQKTVSDNLSNDRFIVAGLNENVIGSGIVAIATIRLDPSLPKRLYPISFNNPIASDTSGSAVLLFATSGVVEIQ